MVSFYDKLACARTQSSPPIVAKLEGIFDALDDGELLEALEGKKHRGCQGYSVETLWRSYLITYVLNIPTVRGLIRALEDNPTLCELSGIMPWAIPHESTYSRFVKKLSEHNGLVKATIKKAVDCLRENLNGFGEVVAIDSTDVKAYSNGRKPSDPDARTGVKRKHGGIYFWHGYKAHMVCDANYELPIHVEVTPANFSDYHAFIGPLRNADISPTHVLADAGYDASYNYGFVVDELNAVPLIDRNKRGKKKDGRVPKRSKSDNRLLALRENPGIERGSEEWKHLYDKRVSIERLFSRMKEFRRLSSVHHRGLAKVTLHAYMSTLTMVASGVASMRANNALRKVA